MNYILTNVYYFRHLNAIGGIESHLRYLAKKYGGKYDISIFYKTGDQSQINRLKSFAGVYKLEDNDLVICKRLFCCFNREILKKAIADKRYLVLHGDYKAMVEQKQLSRENLPIDPMINEYLGVSQRVCDSWFELTGIKARNVYEPVVLDEIERPLMFISATRLTREKGWERMKRLASILDDCGVNYLWYIFTNTKVEPLPNMVICPPRLDITDKLAGFDAFIQLSDNEGFCLSVVEALLRKVPVIATELPVLKEIGVNEENSILLPFNMNKIPVEEIKRIREKKFDYKPPEDNFAKYLDKRKVDKKVKVKASANYSIRNIIDTELNRIPARGEVWEISRQRYYEIRKFEEKNRIHLIDII